MNLLIAGPGPDGCICQVQCSNSDSHFLPGVPKQMHRALSNILVSAHSLSTGSSGKADRAILLYTCIQHHFPPALLLLSQSAVTTKTTQCQNASLGSLCSLIIEDMPHQQQETWNMIERRCTQEVCTVQRTSKDLLKRQHCVLGHISWEVSIYIVLKDV